MGNIGISVVIQMPLRTFQPKVWTFFDEGLFFIKFLPIEMLTVHTGSLSLSGDLFRFAFPNASNWDVLGLRQIGFWGTSIGILVLLASAGVFFFRKGVRGVSSFLSLTACVFFLEDSFILVQ